MSNPTTVEKPMDEIGTDLFDAIGKKWLSTIDRYSGYAWLKQLSGKHTAKITSKLSTIFNSLGWPKSMEDRNFGKSLESSAKPTPYSTNWHLHTIRNLTA